MRAIDVRNYSLSEVDFRCIKQIKSHSLKQKIYCTQEFSIFHSVKNYCNQWKTIDVTLMSNGFITTLCYTPWTSFTLIDFTLTELKFLWLSKFHFDWIKFLYLQFPWQAEVKNFISVNLFSLMNLFPLCSVALFRDIKLYCFMSWNTEIEVRKHIRRHQLWVKTTIF